MLEMEKEEKELLVMVVLLAGQYDSEHTTRGRKKLDWYRYSFEGENSVLEHLGISTTWAKRH